MKKTVLRYGLFAAMFMCAFFTISFSIGKKMSYEAQEVMGYIGIVISLAFVYFGIRQYRDSVKGGQLSFGQGLKIGLLIVLIPSLLFGLFDVAYTSFVNPNFYEDYGAHMIEQMKKDTPVAEFEAKAKKMKEEMAMFKDNPFFQFIVMFLTVFVIGFIVSVISSLILRKTN